MKELLTSNGWIPKGGCSQCGVQNWVNPDFSNYTFKTKQNMNLFKLTRNGADVYGYTNGSFLAQKIEELNNMQEA